MSEENKTGSDNPYKVPDAALSSSDVYAPQGKMYTQAMLEHLKNTKPWVRFMAVLGFIGIGFMILVGLITAFSGNLVDTPMGGSLAAFGLIYVVFGAIYLAPTILLNKYATSINQLLLTGETSHLENALRDQKSYWKFMGIAIIVGIVVGIIAIVVVSMFTINTFLNGRM